ncbi:MAG: hypothetical protein A2Y40_08775 [Candidatus Margulisbacteria bacterium GWF2_35_9]|nr:MAG: hypothetical protein A2Y40_08775 [Candidatus Margulisbacteria bacterium GWF2_35_9]
MDLANNNVDIFCRVIDNYGDAGFSYRLALVLCRRKGIGAEIRLFIDNLKTLHKIVPEIDPTQEFQRVNDITVILFDDKHILSKKYEPASLIIESLASNIPIFLKESIMSQSQLILNIEHLTAETAFESMHGLSMPGYPIPRFLVAQGFSDKTAGILIEDDILQKIQKIEKNRKKIRKTLFSQYVELAAVEPESILLVSVFSYQHDFSNLVIDLAKLERPVMLYVLGELSQESIHKLLNDKPIVKLSDKLVQLGNLYFVFENFLTMEDYDRLLMVSDFNFVRGEDSLARAILAGNPFIWHSYDQGDNYHLNKVSAFLNVLSKYQDDEILFKEYSHLLLAYNVRQSNAVNVNSDENYSQYLNKFAKIKNWVYHLRQFLIERGGLITEIERFIEKI